MNQADPENIPRHVAVIMDGNGRWAKERGQERVYGHVNGVESMRKVIRAAMKWGVKYLTAYAFSTENWGRPREEVDALMELLCRTIADETDELDANGVRIRFIGQTDVLSDVVRESISRSERSTKHNDKLHLIIALNYSSRWEIVRMAQRVATQVRDGDLQVCDIDAEVVSRNLETADRGVSEKRAPVRSINQIVYITFSVANEKQTKDSDDRFVFTGKRSRSGSDRLDGSGSECSDARLRTPQAIYYQ